MPLRAKGGSLALILVLAVTGCFSSEEPAELSVYGPYVGPEADIFGEVLQIFSDRTGITTNYIGSGTFQADFQDRVNSADLADVTVLPQLALIDPLMEEGYLAPLDEGASAALADTVGDFWAAVVAPEGVALAVPYRFVVKSIVWYRADMFAARGYEVPETLAEMKALTRRIVDDGYTPWCAGMDAAGATGWWATDWIEDLVVRRVGAVDYWDWAFLNRPFTDGAIVSAMREFQDLVDIEGAFKGGRRALLNTRVEEAMDPMFDQEPGCLMHKQASFQSIWLPSGVEFGDGMLDIFPLPGVEPGGPPMLISGEVAVATSENPAATELLEFLFSEEAFEPWLDASGSLVARANPSTEESRNELDRRLSDLIAGANTVVIDASDLMPQPVGTGSFFAGMVDLVAGRPPSDVAAEIQDSVDALPPR